MKNKVISFIEAPCFKNIDDTLDHRDLRLILFQLGVLKQALRDDVPDLEQLHKLYFVFSNLRELCGDRVSRITDRINRGEKYTNGQEPRDIHAALRQRIIETIEMATEVQTQLFAKLENQGVFKMHKQEELSVLKPENQDYIKALYSPVVDFETLKTLSAGTLSDDEIRALLTTLQVKRIKKGTNRKTYVLVDEKGRFTEELKKQLIDDDPLLFKAEKMTEFKRWLKQKPKAMQDLVELLRQKYLLTHLNVLTNDLLTKATNADVGMAIRHGRSNCFVPFHRQLKRVIELPYLEGNTKQSFVFTEDIIRQNLKELVGIEPEKAETSMVLFVRDGNVPFIKGGGSKDFRKPFFSAVLARDTNKIVEIMVAKGCPRELQRFVSRNFNFTAGFHKNIQILRRVMPIEVSGRIDPRYVADIYKAIKEYGLKYPDHQPIMPNFKSYVRRTMFKDFLFHWPYHGFILDDAMNETIDIFEYLKDPAVLGKDKVKLSLYQSLYRTDEESSLMQALERAAKSGASAHLLVERKARQDETNNFNMERRLTAAGVDVQDGFPNKKMHTKVTVAVLEIKQSGLLNKTDFSSAQWQEMIMLGLIEEVDGQEGKAVVTKIFNPLLIPVALGPKVAVNNIMPQSMVSRLNLTSDQESKLLNADIVYRFSHVGTGNIRKRTAELYVDINTITSNPKVGRECVHMFNSLTPKIFPDEPLGEMWFGNHIKEHIREEIEKQIDKVKNGEEGYICIQVNQIDHEETKKLLYKASKAGVKVDLFTRGFNEMKLSNLEPWSLTNADVDIQELRSDPSRIITNDQAMQIWEELQRIGVLDADKTVSDDYLSKRNHALSIMVGIVGAENAKQIMQNVLDKAFKKISEVGKNIRLYRVIDRYLEHSRVYIFGKGNDAKVVIGSSDAMKRGLDKREEAMRVIEDLEEKQLILDIMEIYKTHQAHMEIMTANINYYQVAPNDKGLTVQEALYLLHRSRTDYD